MSFNQVDNIVIESLNILKGKLGQATAGDAIAIAEKINALADTFYKAERKGMPVIVNLKPTEVTPEQVKETIHQAVQNDPKAKAEYEKLKEEARPDALGPGTPRYDAQTLNNTVIGRPKKEDRRHIHEVDPNPHNWTLWRRDDLKAFGFCGRVSIDLRSNCSYRKFAGYAVRVLGSKKMVSKTDPRMDLVVVATEGFLKGQVFEMNLTNYNPIDGNKIPPRGQQTAYTEPGQVTIKKETLAEAKAAVKKEEGECPKFDWDGDFDEHPWIGRDFYLMNPFGCDVDVQRAVGGDVVVLEVLPHKHPIHKTQIKAEVMGCPDGKQIGREIWVNPDNLMPISRE